MFFYRTQSPVTPFARTLADAQATGAKWEKVDLDVSHAGLTKLFNELATAPRPGAPEPVKAVDAFREEQEFIPPPPTKGLNQHGYHGVASGPHQCPKCDRSVKAAAIIADIEMRDAITDAMQLMDAAGLDKLQSLMDDRRAALVQPVAPTPAPRARSRAA